MIKLSASSIGTFDKCAKKYFFTYIEKPDIVKQDWSHLEAGSYCHRVLELFHIHLMKNVVEPKDYSKLLSQFMAEALGEFKKDILKNDWAEIKKMLNDYLLRLRQEGLAQVVGVELPFNFQIGDYTVKGFIDRVDKVGPGQYKVVDYKTSKNPKYLDSFQLLLYAIAVKEMYADARQLSGAYVLLKHSSDLKSWDFSEKDLENAIEKVKKTGDRIKVETRWQKKVTKLCDWCDFKSVCLDSWTEEEVDIDI